MPAQSGRLGKSNEELLAGDLVLRLFMQLVDIDLASEVPPKRSFVRPSCTRRLPAAIKRQAG